MSALSEKLKSARIPFVSVVVVAGGSGTRFGSDKMLADLAGVPVIIHALRTFDRSPFVNEIVLVTRKEILGDMAELCARYGIEKLARVVPGGKTRLESSCAGVAAASPKSGVIAIHDGARPLVTQKVVEDALWQANRKGAAVPAVAVRDTIKQAKDSVVFATPDRAELFAVQTPQCFQADLIRTALSAALEKAPNVTDDCMAVERIGGHIYLTEGSEENLKITTPLDLVLAEVILQRRKEA